MTKKRKRLYLTFIGYFVVLMCIAVLPPSVRTWNTIEPHVFGLPFAQLTVIALAILFCVGLLTWFRLEGRLNAEEAGQRKRGEPLEY